MRSSSDPLRLCRWVGDSAEGVSLITMRNGDEERRTRVAGADAYVSGESPAGLSKRIAALLEREMSRLEERRGAMHFNGACGQAADVAIRRERW